MKRNLLPLALACLSLSALAKEETDVVRVVDWSSGIDTIYNNVSLRVEYLYTDSMRIAVLDSISDKPLHWFNQSQVEYFRQAGELFEPRKVVMDDGQPHRLLMKRDKGSRSSKAMIYTLGKGRYARYYIRPKNSEELYPLASNQGGFSDYARNYLDTLWLDPTHATKQYIDQQRGTRSRFRLAERIMRQHNDHYLRRFTWGVMAGLHSSQAEVTGGLGELESQLCATAGLWADLPLDTWGFSARVEACYYAYSCHADEARGELAYNHRSVELPLLLRYTALPVRGRFMPYVEGGLLLDIPFRQDVEGLNHVPSSADGEYFVPWKGDFSSGTHSGIVVGAGVETRLNARHSAWLGVRCRLQDNLDEFSYDKSTGTVATERSGWTLTLMYNL